MVRFVAPFLVAAATLSSYVAAAPLPCGDNCAPAPKYEPKYEAPEPAKVAPSYEPPMKEEQPKYEAPSYEPPMKEEPKYEPEPSKVAPAVQPPMYEPPMKEEPPMHEAPMKEEPKMEEPMKEEPKMEEPMKEEPKMEEPMKEAPKEQYGSGSTDKGSNYNDCVSKCMAQYGAPPSSYTPPPSKVEQPSSGKVHTVLVAPTAGVLRYVPPILDVPVGDTVKFVWNGPNNHTVSKSSQLDMCNKTADAFFTSGVQSGSFEFTRTVNDTDTTYFYCSVGVHCAKGMFGLVNPKKGAATGSNMTVASMMPSWTAKYPDLAAAWSTVHEKTQGTPADTWANDVDVSSIPEAQYKGLAENVVYYRRFLSENPGVQELDAGASLPAGITEFKIPSDITSLLSNSAGNPQGAVGAPAGAAPTDAVPTGAAPNPTGLGSSAGSVRSSGLMVAVVAIAATLFAL